MSATSSPTSSDTRRPAPYRSSSAQRSRKPAAVFFEGASRIAKQSSTETTFGSETRRLAVVSAGTGNPVLRATLPANDPFMRVLTGASARIFVRIGDAQPLVMPPSPTIAAYARQCTNGEVQAPPTAAGNSIEATGSVNVVAGNAATDAN